MMGAGISNADPNSFGATIVFTLPLVIWAGVFSRSWFIRICALGYVGLAGYSVFMSSSRSALVLTVLTCLFTLVLLRKGWPRLIGIAAFVIAGIACVGVLDDAQKERIQSIWSGSTYSEDKSTADRVEGYHIGFRIFQANPVFGVGPGNWSSYRMRRVDGRKLLPHNLTGQIVATRGALGTLTFIGFLMSSFAFGIRTWRKRRRGKTRWDRASAALCLTCMFTLFLMLVSGLGAHNLERGHWAWIPALMIVGVTCRDEDWEQLQRDEV